MSRKMVGLRFGKLVVLERSGSNKHGAALWACKCDCGNMITARGDVLREGRKTSCGCEKSSRFADLTGQRFGRLIAYKPVKKPDSSIFFWECVCDCGNSVIVRGDHLREGRAKSCGCYKTDRAKQPRKHGESYSRLHNIWRGMRQRCNNPRYKHYSNYGGRGITVCEAWDNFSTFRNWALLNNYNEQATLDRINNDGNYEPRNCRWTTQKVQANNRRNSFKYTFPARFIDSK